MSEHTERIAKALHTPAFRAEFELSAATYLNAESPEEEALRLVQACDDLAKVLAPLVEAAIRAAMLEAFHNGKDADAGAFLDESNVGECWAAALSALEGREKP